MRIFSLVNATVGDQIIYIFFYFKYSESTYKILDKLYSNLKCQKEKKTGLRLTFWSKDSSDLFCITES